jgi:alkylation response protein AidB-like acyl-CoA dehydrogenase
VFMLVVSHMLPGSAMHESVDLLEIGSTYIEFDQVEIPVTNLLGEENKGFPVIMNSELVIITMPNLKSKF